MELDEAIVWHPLVPWRLRSHIIMIAGRRVRPWATAGLSNLEQARCLPSGAEGC